MSIDPTVIAQFLTSLVGFLLFFWVAKILFWKSLLGAIEKRQQAIRGEFDKAADLQKQMESLKEDYARRLADIESEARQKLQEEMARGRQIAEQIAEQAKKDAEHLIARAQQTVSIEMDKAREELKRDVVRLTVGATERIIREKLDDTKSRELVTQFVEELARN